MKKRCAVLIGILTILNLLYSCKPSYLDLLRDKNTDEAYKEFLLKSEINVPVYPLTKGPAHHWFGYYDKYQTDPTNRYVLSMQSTFENRSPKPDDIIKIGMIDVKNGGEWIQLGTTKAWNWQQGCMLQWRPGSAHEVIWNDRVKGKFVSHIFNIETMKKRTLPAPVYTLSPDGKFAITLDFERVQDVRKGYGYSGVSDSNKDELAPLIAGIYKVSLDDGTKTLIVSIDEVAQLDKDLSENKHYFNHLDINTSGDRFLFLHRWVIAGRGARVSPLGTKLLTASVDGGNLRVLNDSKMTSHFWWKNNNQILAWANRPKTGNHFYLFEDNSHRLKPEIIGEELMNRDGHCSYLGDTDWILNDTYPDKNRRIELYLFNAKTSEKIVLGKFYLPEQYTAEWRVDLHPRLSRDKKKIMVDCVIGKSGRQQLLLDISYLGL
jgi:hypothetical protein